MTNCFYIIDTSIILSGKPIDLDSSPMVTTSSVSAEIKSGGRDHRLFQYLLEKGLIIRDPSKKAIEKIHDIATETGDINRLSDADIDILALAVDLKNEKKDVIILSDDYSIQNVAAALNMKFQSFNQRGITKKLKWQYRCPGCGKQFQEPVKECPICGTEIKSSFFQEKQI